MRSRITETRPLPVCGTPPATPADPGRAASPDRRMRSPLAGARERTASVADLREMILAARPDIVEAGADIDRRMELSYEVRKILTELAAGSVDLLRVRDRWKRIRDLLGPVAGTNRIAQITDLLIALLAAPALPGPAR